MSIPKKLQKFLKKHKVSYEVLVHPEAYTSCEITEAEHVSGKEVAKVVMAKGEGEDAMFVVPSHHTLDLLKLKTALGTENIRIEEEREFQELFPDCEVGAMPPLGKLYHLPCFVDQSLKEGDSVTFNAGTHRESIQISTEDFLRIVKAQVGDFSVTGKKIAV